MRTTATDVKLIIDTSLADATIEAYIGTASDFVDNALAGTTLSENSLTIIEKWLTAHLIASTQERVTTEEGAGGAYAKYAGVFGEGLKSTPYGQMAITLDMTGTLVNIAAGKKSVSITAITSFQ